MAHAATIHELSGKLVASITGLAPVTNNFKQSVNETSKALKGSGHARTNQFEISSKLDGLVEKFAVLNREDLSAELQARMNELPTESKWLPEVLSLLLSLSDRPLEKTKLEDVESLVEEPNDADALDWNEIFADRSADEPGLWDEVDHGYHSSGDDSSVDEANVTTSTNATSVHEEDLAALARLHVTQPDESSLQSIKEFRTRLEHDDINERPLSELFVIRESLSMMHGLPTELYDTNSVTDVVSVEQRFGLETASTLIMSDMLARLADLGSRLNYLRTWLRAQTRLRYLQSCRAAVQSSFRDFQSYVAAIETRYAAPENDLVVSIIDVGSELERLARPVLVLSKLIRRSEERSSGSSFALLDFLYEEICIAQVSEDTCTIATLLKVFTAGLRTHLKPVSSWIQTGSLNDVDESFFVVENDADCDLANVWQERFAMRRLKDSGRSVPAFLEDMTDRIFSLGKSRAVLSMLGTSAEQDSAMVHVLLPDFQWLADQVHSFSLTPFSRMLSDLLQSWIDKISEDCTPALCRTILRDHRLLDNLDGMTDAFCSRNGRLFQTFADTLFWRVDAGRNWRDSFLLTELAQSTLGSAAGINPDALSISFAMEQMDLPHSSILQLEAIKLEMLFTWPLQNVTRSRSPTSYSGAFTILLQIFRAKYLLRRQQDRLRLLGKKKERRSNNAIMALRVRQFIVVIVDILHNHVTSTLSILCATVRDAMEHADGIDAMEKVWMEHEKQVEFSLLLTSNLKPLKEAMLSVLQLCEQFHEIWDVLFSDLTASDERGTHDRDDDRAAPSRLEVSQRSAHNKLVGLRAELEKSLGFISAGVRATSRAAGSTTLEALSDRLQWCLEGHS